VHAVLRSQGGEDKTNFVINAFKTLSANDIHDLKPIDVLTPGNADAPGGGTPDPTAGIPSKETTAKVTPTMVRTPAPEVHVPTKGKPNGA
jgi:hypothetical protein